ncbi:MAG: GNAT family N-acetyltransferase [Proteobacteria bacterium]|nr:GNAT family N-acetyltransferase [Pseudomonadota bacterium]
MMTRKATNADCHAIAELTAQLGYLADVSEIRERLAKILPRDDYAVYVAEDDAGAIVGWIQTRISHLLGSGLMIEIVGLIVAENARRRGVGHILVQCAEKWALEHGANEIIVRSNTKRIASHLFYPSLGFQPAKSQQVYRKKIVLRTNQ